MQDCDGLADDPHFKYETDLTRVTKDSITFTLVNKQPVSKKGRYHYEIEYFPLRNSAQVTVTPRLQLPAARGVQDKLHDITLTGLEPATVYALKVRLYRMRSTVLNYVTESGDFFYGTTNGGRVGGLEEVRTKILLNGFKELGDSQLGRIGYMGSDSRDGIRYGASTAEQWCTEFYAYVTNSWLGFSSGGLDYSGAVINAFKEDRSWYAAYSDPAATQDNVPEYVRTNARRGDYLAEDSNGDGNIESNHSAIFLAWDESAGKFWSLDGNSDGRGGNGNYVGVKQNTFSYANSPDNGGNTAYRAVGVGKLTCGMVGADCSSGK